MTRDEYYDARRAYRDYRWATKQWYEDQKAHKPRRVRYSVVETLRDKAAELGWFNHSFNESHSSFDYAREVYVWLTRTDISYKNHRPGFVDPYPLQSYHDPRYPWIQKAGRKMLIEQSEPTV